LRDSVEAVTGLAPAFEVCPGLLETRFYADLGIPALAYGPGVLALAHGPDESVNLSRMVDCATVYAVTAARLFAARTAAHGLSSP
jgi:succinyl-diaminopimelate desuccinylase